jgi:hypothetical protein
MASSETGPADGEPVVIGFDVAVLGVGGQIGAVYGFLDKGFEPLRPRPAGARKA